MVDIDYKVFGYTPPNTNATTARKNTLNFDVFNNTQNAAVQKQISGLKDKYNWYKLNNPNGPNYNDAQRSFGTKALIALFKAVDAPRQLVVGSIAGGMNAVKALKQAYGKDTSYDYVNNEFGKPAAPWAGYNALKLFDWDRPHTYWNNVVESWTEPWLKAAKKKGYEDTWQYKTINNQGLKTFSGIAGDVIFDPLTWVTLGGSSAGRGGIKGASVGVGALTEKGASTLDDMMGLATKIFKIGGKADNSSNYARSAMNMLFSVVEGNKEAPIAAMAKALGPEGYGMFSKTDDALRYTTKMLNRLYKLKRAGDLFDTSLIKFADWVPGLKGKEIIPRMFSGTTERTISLAGDFFKTEIPRPLASMFEEAIFKNLPEGAAQLAQKMRRLVTGNPSLPGKNMDKTANAFFRQGLGQMNDLLNYDQVQALNRAKQITNDIVKKFNLTDEELTVVTHTREILNSTKSGRNIIKDYFLAIKNEMNMLDSLTKAGRKGRPPVKQIAKAEKALGEAFAGLASYTGMAGQENTLLGMFQKWDELTTLSRKGSKKVSKKSAKEALASLTAKLDEAANEIAYAEMRKSLNEGQNQLLDVVAELEDTFHGRYVEAGALEKMQKVKGHIAHIPKEKTYGQMDDAIRRAKSLQWKGKQTKARKFATIEAAERAGVKHETNPVFLTMVDDLMSSNANRVKSFIDDVVRNYGRQYKTGTRLPEGFGLFKDFNTGKTYQLPEFMATALNKQGEIFNTGNFREFTRFYDKVQSLWKGYVTATPGFTMRNALFGNTWAGFLQHGQHYFKPSTMRDGIMAYFASMAGELEKHTNVVGVNKILKAINGTSSSGIPYRVLGEELAKNGILRTGGYGFDLLGSINSFEELERLMYGKPSMLNKINPLSNKNSFLKTFRDFNTRVEDVSKSMAFVLEAGRQSGDYRTAGLLTKKFFFDYSDLTASEKNVFKRFVPFYTWQRKNIPLQIEQLIMQTGKYKVFPLGKHYIEDLSRDGAPNEANLPDYMMERYWIRSPIVDKYGNYLYFNPNYPPQDLASVFNPKDWLGMLSPLLKVPLELATNRNFFFDSAIKENDFSWSYGPTYLKALPKGVQTLLNIHENEKTGDVMMDPRQKYLLEQLPQTRLINRLLFSSPNSSSQQSRGPQSFATFTGFKFLAYDEEKEAQKAMYAERDRYMQALKAFENWGYNVQNPPK